MRNFAHILAMELIDKGIKGYKQLYVVSGVGYEIVVNLMKGSTNIKLNQLNLITKAQYVDNQHLSGES